MNNLAMMYLNQGRYEEAESLYVRTLDLRRRVLGEEHPDTLISMNELAGCYREQGLSAEAEPLFTSATAKARESLPEGHWLMGNFIYEQGLYLAKMGRHDEAEAALLEANEILEDAFGTEHFQTTGVIKALVVLYDAWGKPDKAAEWRAKLPEPEIEPEPQPAEGGSE